MGRSQTIKRRYKYDPDYTVPPGGTLAETIEYLGIAQKEFAARSGFTEKHISQVINGKAPITPDAALRFERVTGVPARIWNNLEKHYQEELAKLACREEFRKDLKWLDEIPIKELVKRGAIPKLETPAEQLESALSFFGVASVEAWRIGWSKRQLAFRKSLCHDACDGAIAAWVRLAEREAQTLTCEPFSAKRFCEALTKIRRLTRELPSVFVPKMKELCAGSGVALALVPEIPKAPVNGAARWLTPDKPMIALNLRGKSNDKFWFTFFHEAGHILNDNRDEVFVDVDYTDDPREQSANEFAANLLIPPEFADRLPGVKSKSAVTAFATALGIHPAIVVGRLQHDRVLPFTHMHDLKVRLIWADA